MNPWDSEIRRKDGDEHMNSLADARAIVADATLAAYPLLNLFGYRRLLLPNPASHALVIASARSATWSLVTKPVNTQGATITSSQNRMRWRTAKHMAI